MGITTGFEIEAMKLPITYAILALIAAAANIGAQDLVVRGYSGAYNLLIAIAAGTGVGLVVKYVLDKRFIFRFRARSTAHDSKTFLLYTLMGVPTTLVFWGFELGFDHLFETKEMRYVGAAIGLAIGFVTKYYLDKHFVFRKEKA